MLPTMNTFSPYVVFAVSLKSTLIAVGVALHVGMVDVDDVGLPVPEETGKVLVAVLHGPVADVAAQLPGTFADDAPQLEGIAAFRAFKAVKNAA